MAELLETLRRAQATAENGEWYLLPERGPAQRQQGLMGVFLARETVAEVVAALERAGEIAEQGCEFCDSMVTDRGPEDEAHGHWWLCGECSNKRAIEDRWITGHLSDLLDRALERVPDLEAEVKGLWDEGQALIRDLEAYATEINDLRARCERQMEQLSGSQGLATAVQAVSETTDAVRYCHHEVYCGDDDEPDRIVAWMVKPEHMEALRAALAAPSQEGDRG